jgi:hypothetical protein
MLLPLSSRIGVLHSIIILILTVLKCLEKSGHNALLCDTFIEHVHWKQHEKFNSNGDMTVSVICTGEFSYINV